MANFRITAICCAAALSACATSAPQQALVPVATSCIPQEIPRLPDTSSATTLAAMDDRSLVLTIASERLDLLSFSRQAAALLEACR